VIHCKTTVQNYIYIFINPISSFILPYILTTSIIAREIFMYDVLISEITLPDATTVSKCRLTKISEIQIIDDNVFQVAYTKLLAI
jgi:hypothetical protein